MLDEQHQHFSLPDLHMDAGPDPRRWHWTQPRAVNISNYGRAAGSLSLIWSSTFEGGQTFMKDREVPAGLELCPTSKFDAHEVAFGEYQTRSWGEVVRYAVGVGVDFFLVGRQWEQDFPERMDPYFSKISWGCDSVNLCD